MTAPQTTAKTMQAAAVGPNRQMIGVEVDIPEVPPKGALIEVIGCGVCGSDVDKLVHRNPVEGTILGHEVVGKIIKFNHLTPHPNPLPKGEGTVRVALAHHVPCETCHYCLHGSESMCKTFKKTNINPGGFAQYAAVTEGHLKHTVFELPDDVSDISGSAIEPLGCCIKAIDRIPPNAGPNVLVIGLGYVGCLTAQVLQKEGYTVYGIDRITERVDLVLKHKMASVADTHAENLIAQIQENTHNIGVDGVFVSIVNQATIQLALKAVRDGGWLMLFSSSEATELPMNELYFREINIMHSYSPSLSSLQKAHQWICNHEIDVEPLYTHTTNLDGLNDAIQLYQQNKAIKVFVQL